MTEMKNMRQPMKALPVEIDGAAGEGGGQILRTSLTLSLVTGLPVRLRNIRAGRSKPGLLRQHLACVKAAADISGAIVEGAEIGSLELTFTPGVVKSGSYEFKVGSAGSTTLVLQTVLLPLLLAEGKSRVRIEGGTHNSMAPSFDFVTESYLPVLCSLGYQVRAVLSAYGFYPAGGGTVSVEIDGVGSNFLKSAPTFDRCGPCKAERELEAFAISSNIPLRIVKAEAALLSSELLIPEDRCYSTAVQSVGPGNAVWVRVKSGDDVSVFTSYGAQGKPLDKVVAECVREVKRFLDSGARVEEHLQDQLLLPLALTSGGAFTTTALSEHTKTNMDVIRAFLPVEFASRELGKDLWEISVLSGMKDK